MLDFKLLQVPPHDGDVLIEPPATQWPALIEHTIRSRAADQADLTMAGIPVHVVRQQTRDRLLGADTGKPVIACGHQPEFIHPGVLAKQVVVRRMADSLEMHGVDIVVDNDSPRSNAITVPMVDAAGMLTHMNLPVLPAATGLAYEGQPPLGHNAIEQILRTAEACLLPALGIHPQNANPHGEASLPLLAEYCRGLAQADRPADFVDQHLAGRHHVDRQFVANLRELRVSRAFNGPFVADILVNLDRFTQAYNASLAEYRSEQHVRGLDRPLPDLKIVDGRMEAPFWIYQPRQQRSRLWIAARGDAIDLFAGDRLAGTLSRADLLHKPVDTLANLAPWSIRPRALTLTLWARLLVCDMFVHGIGGAKYDRVTDGIFRRYYRCEPPPYACFTATLRLPLHRYPATTADLAATRRRSRDVRFNPQRYIAAPPADLLAERDRLIAASKLLHEQRGPRIDRLNAFNAIRRINAQLHEIDPQTVMRLEQQLDLTRQQLLSNVVADSREFFYALQPRARLETLARRLIQSAGGEP
jgi:hypothetical protein